MIRCLSICYKTLLHLYGWRNHSNQVDFPWHNSKTTGTSHWTPRVNSKLGQFFLLFRHHYKRYQLGSTRLMKSWTHWASAVVHNTIIVTESIASSVYNSWATCFTNPTPPPARSFTSSSRTVFTDYFLDRFFWATRFLFFSLFFVSVPYARLSCPSCQILSAR